MEKEMIVRSVWIFSGLGTVGDVLPLLSIAREAKRRGHEIYFLTNENHRQLVEAEGVFFKAIAAGELSQEHRVVDMYKSSVVPSYRISYDFAVEKLKLNTPVIVINNNECSGTNFACEKFNIPLVRGILTPCIEWNIKNPVYSITEVKNKALKYFLQYVLAPFIGWIHIRFSYTKEGINAFRKSVGLPQISDLSHMINLPWLKLRAYPEWFGERKDTDDENCIEIGFPFCNQNNNVSVDEFLEHKRKYGSCTQ